MKSGKLECTLQPGKKRARGHISWRRDVVILRLRVFWLCDDTRVTVNQAWHAVVAIHQNVRRVRGARPISIAE